MSTQNIMSVQEISKALFEDVQHNIHCKDNENFYLVGYSFGAMVAIEIAKLLEESGLKGQIVLIDGAPTFLKKLVVDQVVFQQTFKQTSELIIYLFLKMPATYSDDAVQIVLISGIMRTVFPEENIDVMEIMKIPTWDSRVEKLLDLSADQYIYSTDYLRKMANCLYQRIKMVIDYKSDSNYILRSPITLVRPTEISIVDVEEDYGLHKLTNGTTNVKYVEGNHLTMLENPKLIQIINELDPAFESNRLFKKHNAI